MEGDMSVLVKYIDKRLLFLRKKFDEEIFSGDIVLITGRMLELKKLKDSIEPLVNGNDISRGSWVNIL